MVPGKIRCEVVCWIASWSTTPRSVPESAQPQEREAQRLGSTAEAAAALVDVLLAVTGAVVDADDARYSLPLTAAVVLPVLASAHPRIGLLLRHLLLPRLPTQHEPVVVVAVAAAAARYSV